MTHDSDDPRPPATRSRLLESLLELTIERGYGKIRVRDILERAAVARSTFYAHFDNKDDLLVGGFDLFRVRPVDREGTQPEPLLPDVEPPLAHAALFRDLYESLAKGGDLDLPLQRVQSDLFAGYSEVFEDLESRDFKLSGPPEILARFATGAFLALMIDWLDRGAKEPAREVAEQFQGLLRRAISG